MGIIVTYTSEIFPTSMRSKGYGLCMTVGKAGCIIVPIYVSYLQIFSQNPLVYLGFLCLVAILLTYRLPETFDKSMQDRLEDRGALKEFELAEKNTGEFEEEDDIFKE